MGDCFSKGFVNGFDDYVGGLIGQNDGSSINCYSMDSVAGNIYVGGLIGYNGGTVANCYSTGYIAGYVLVGGLSGINNGSIKLSFWDTESSNQSSSAGGTGVMTKNMKNARTFLEAGWDDSIWYIDAGFNNGYPYLIWQNPNGSPLPVEKVEQLPTEYFISQNYPNPFNPSTIIRYEVPQTCVVTIKIYDILGKEITTLVNEEKSIGNYEINFDASSLASGVYIYKMQAGEFTDVKKMVLLR